MPEPAPDIPTTGMHLQLGMSIIEAPFGASEAIDSVEGGVVTTVDVPTDRLGAGPAEYRCLASLIVEGAITSRGWVTSVVETGGRTRITFSAAPPLWESTIGFLSVAHVPPQEVAWSLAHWIEVPPRIDELKGVRETIDVAMPLRGLSLSDSSVIGEVELTPNKAFVEELAVDLKKAEPEREFLGASAWALVRAEASYLFVAEQAAVPLVEAAVNQLALEAQFSFASDPSGKRPPFRRAGLFAQPTVDRTTLVRGRSTGRAWMRALDRRPIRPDVDERRIRLPAIDPDEQWTEAVRAWRRATRATDRIEGIGALFEAIEFYCSRTRGQSDFTTDEVESARSALVGLQLDDRMRSRLLDLLNRINETPLRIRFAARLVHDEVPHSEEEIARVWNLRKVRNDAIHGRNRNPPNPDDYDLATGLVNRALVYRHARRAASLKTSRQ